MKRHLVATGVSAVALCLGATSALAADQIAPVEGDVPIAADGSGGPPEDLIGNLLSLLLGGPLPPTASLSQAAVANAAGSSSASQVVPAAVATAVSAPVNANVPVGVAAGGAPGDPVHQSSTSAAAAAAANDVTAQSGSGGAGAGAGQSSSSDQAVPVAVGAGVSAPVNLNLPVGILSQRRTGTVTQLGDASALGAAANSASNQIAGGGGSAAQSSSNGQVVPVAVGAAVSAPININLPIDILDGDSTELGDTLESAVGGLFRGPGGTVDAVLRDPLGSVEGLLEGLLSLGADEGDAGGQVIQHSRSHAVGAAFNNVVSQQGSSAGAAGQAASAGQVVPAAVAAAVSLPLNANLPVGVLQDGDTLEPAPVEQVGQAHTRAEAVNRYDQQLAGGGGSGDSTAQSSSSEQLLPIGVAADLAVPINLNVPVSLLGHPLLDDGHVDLSIVQRVLDAVGATLKDPLGTLKHALLEDPAGTVKGLLTGKP